MPHFDTLLARPWRSVFHDDMTGDWRRQWFLDGDHATLNAGPRGLDFAAGADAGDAGHAVLWTRPEFAGDDLKIEFDYTRTDDATVNVNILYIQATGSGSPGFDRDISLWSDKRRVAAMHMYFQHMNTLHVSFAALPMRNDDPDNDYVRARRYVPSDPATAGGLKGTDIEPDTFRTGLFKPGVPHHMTWIKLRSELHLKVICPDTERLFRWDTSGVEPVTVGRIGLRHMFFRSARYANFDVALAG